ncbi:MAG: glycosyltransferase family 2 protein [Solobacterium sp.]|nr:glycosyltransferase family 2 protein [Solobacterium sp.]
MNQPVVTVVIPVYNVEQFLRECLDSILAQTYESLEILAVNDGSTDGSRAILEDYVHKDLRVILLDKPNGGLSDARNYGILHANGKYICFIDGDDTISPKYVELLLKGLESGADISVSDMEYVYEDGHREFSSGGVFQQSSIHEQPDLIRINNSACNKLYKTELFQEVQFPVGKLYEDLATVPIQIYRSSLVTKVDEPLYFYRQRSGSIQHSTDRRVFHIYDAIDRVKEYVTNHGNEAAVQREIEQMYLIFGLDITTLKIKDMEHTKKREELLKENMNQLVQRVPDYMNSSFVRNAGFRKKLIYRLLSNKYYGMVLKIYDR